MSLIKNILDALHDHLFKYVVFGEFIVVALFVIISYFIPNKPIIQPDLLIASSFNVGFNGLRILLENKTGLTLFVGCWLCTAWGIVILGMGVARLLPYLSMLDSLYDGSVMINADVIRTIIDSTYQSAPWWFTMSIVVYVFTLSLQCLEWLILTSWYFHYQCCIHHNKKMRREYADAEDQFSTQSQICIGEVRAKNYQGEQFMLFIMKLLIYLFLVNQYAKYLVVSQALYYKIPYWTENEYPEYILVVSCILWLAPVYLESERLQYDDQDNESSDSWIYDNEYRFTGLVLYLSGMIMFVSALIEDCRLPAMYQITCPSPVYMIRFNTGFDFDFFDYTVNNADLSIVFGRLSIANHWLGISSAVISLAPLCIFVIWWFVNSWRCGTSKPKPMETTRLLKERNTGHG